MGELKHCFKGRAERDKNTLGQRFSPVQEKWSQKRWEYVSQESKKWKLTNKMEEMTAEDEL